MTESKKGEREEPKYLFIDTNVFLKVYSYSDDHPPLLKELLDLIRKNRIKVIINRQVIDEFYRNRESKLKPSLKTIRNLRDTPFKIPAFCHNISKIKEIESNFKKINSLSKDAYKKLIEDIKKENLEVDKSFKEIFTSSGIVEITKDIFDRAKKRMELGNPPGKRRSYGDAIHWEILLKEIPKGKTIYFICEDGDFLSEIDKNEFSPILEKEWKEKKNSNLILYKSISKFLKKEFQKKQITKKQIEVEEKTFQPVAITEDDKGDFPSSGAITYTGSAFFPHNVISSTSPLGTEKEIRCNHCGKIFYTKSYEFTKQCPYCNNTTTSYLY